MHIIPGTYNCKVLKDLFLIPTSLLQSRQNWQVISKPIDKLEVRRPTQVQLLVDLHSPETAGGVFLAPSL
jgi:hypothetical protein